MIQCFNKMRQRLQQTKFIDFLSPILVKKSGLLDDKGHPMVFKNIPKETILDVVSN